MIFNYNATAVFLQAIEVEDPGNTALLIETEAGFDYYIYIKTVMGKTSVIKFGPIMTDVQVLIDTFTTTYQKFDYKEKVIDKIISQYINDGRKKVTNVIEIPQEQAIAAYPNIAECLLNEE